MIFINNIKNNQYVGMLNGIPQSLFNNIDTNFYDTLINKLIYIYKYTLTFNNLTNMTDEDYNNYDKIILYYINNIIIRKSNNEFINYKHYVYDMVDDGFVSGHIIKLFFVLINYAISKLRENRNNYNATNVQSILQYYTMIHKLNLLILFNIRIYLLSFTYKKMYVRKHNDEKLTEYEIRYPTLLFARLSLSNKYFYGNQITGDILDYTLGASLILFGFRTSESSFNYKKLTFDKNLKDNKYICNLKDVIQSLNYIMLNVIHTIHTINDLNIDIDVTTSPSDTNENQNLTLDEYYKIIPRTLEDDYQEYIHKGTSTTTGGKKSRKSRKSKKSNALITKSGKNKKTK
jgi:hypothetical protein